jgi:D-alanine-D-alanine ligase
MKLCILLGGPSAEREVSLMSGFGMAKALRENGHMVTLLDPATGRAMQLEEFESNPPNAEPPSLEQLGQLGQGAQLIESLTSETIRNSDAVVLGVHGVPGEDGLFQAVFELLGKPYTGTDARASALCIDKALTKIIIEEAGVASPRWAILDRDSDHGIIREAFEEIRDELKLPVVIKPNDQGSTVGLTILKEDSASAFEAAVELTWKYSKKALIEEFIEGRELTVTVIGDRALPIVEIAPEGGFYDYHHKYTKGMTVYTCPAVLPKDVEEGIQADALTVFECCGARGYARIDFRLRPDNTWSCLEINTLPGMTETSLTPKAAAAAGISFNDLCEAILQSAFTPAQSAAH